jgi:hypothetical protein
MDMIADRVIDARRRGWQWEADGARTRRTLGFASLGGATVVPQREGRDARQGQSARTSRRATT